MSDLEVVAAVSAVVSAFHGGADLVKQIRQRNKRKRSEQAVKEKLLQESLEAGEIQTSERYAAHYRDLGVRFRIGNDHARSRLLQIAIAMQSEVIRSLQIALQYENAVLNLTSLQEDSVLNRRDTLAILDELHQNLMDEVRMAKPTIPSRSPNRPAAESVKSYMTAHTSAPDFVPSTVVIPPPAQEPQNGFSRFLSKRRNTAERTPSPGLTSRITMVSNLDWLETPSNEPVQPDSTPSQRLGSLSLEETASGDEERVDRFPSTSTRSNNSSIYTQQSTEESNRSNSSMSQRQMSPTSEVSSFRQFSPYSELSSEYGRTSPYGESYQVPRSYSPIPEDVPPSRSFAPTDLSYSPSEASPTAQTPTSVPYFEPPPTSTPTSPTPTQKSSRRGTFSHRFSLSRTMSTSRPGSSSGPASNSPKSTGITQNTALIGRPSKDNNYWGICKGAWSAQEDMKKGLHIQHRPEGLYNSRSFWQCRHCLFQADGFATSKAGSRPAKDVKFDTSPRDAPAGVPIRYRWAFLAKSHVKRKTLATGAERARPEYNYGCLFCCVDGRGTGIFGNVETLMVHIWEEHSRSMMVDVRERTRCVFGTAADEGDLSWDINIPAKGPQVDGGSF